MVIYIIYENHKIEKISYIDIEKYKIDKEKFMTGSSTESVNITFSNGEDLIDAAGIVLSSTKESELHGVNCYRAVIRNKNKTKLSEEVYGKNQ